MPPTELILNVAVGGILTGQMEAGRKKWAPEKSLEQFLAPRLELAVQAGDEGATGAVPHATYDDVNAPWAPPGTYTVRLTVDGKAYSEKLVVTNDPRSPASAAIRLAVSATQPTVTRIQISLRVRCKSISGYTQPIDHNDSSFFS